MTTQPEALLAAELEQQKIAGSLGALDARACCRRRGAGGRRAAGGRAAVEEGVVAGDVCLRRPQRHRGTEKRENDEGM